MSSANINDASTIQALLDQLKSSEAWQQVANPNLTPVGATGTSTTNATATAERSTDGITSSTSTADAHESLYQTTHDSPQFTKFSPESHTPAGSSSAPSVAALLSQLQASGSFNVTAGSRSAPIPALAPAPAHVQLSHPRPFSGGPNLPRPDAELPESTHPPAPHTPRQDLRACTFQQALPHLAQLSEDPGFLKALTAMRTEQAGLERQLWHERRDIQRKHEDRVKTARTKANIIGAGLTQYEADALTDSFRTELLKFDRERVLPAWDGLVTKQQAALEALGVPAMFPSTQTSDRERQQKIMQVLGGIVGNEGSTT